MLGGAPVIAPCKACQAIEAGMDWLAKGMPHTPTEPKPTITQLQAWVLDSVCDATDGCQVEPDGRCPHGHESWLLVYGLV
jgi:hypothetical protein